jgi:hypothetical protein
MKKKHGSRFTAFISKHKWMNAIVAGSLIFVLSFGYARVDHGVSEGAPSQERLASLFREYSEAADLERLYRLVYWSGEQGNLRENYRRFVEKDFPETIERIEIVPLPGDDSPHYMQGGIQYRPNLDPIGRLVVQFKPRRDFSYNSQYLVGKKEGRYYIVLASPVHE